MTCSLFPHFYKFFFLRNFYRLKKKLKGAKKSSRELGIFSFINYNRKKELGIGFIPKKIYLDKDYLRRTR